MLASSNSYCRYLQIRKLSHLCTLSRQTSTYQENKWTRTVSTYLVQAKTTQPPSIRFIIIMLATSNGKHNVKVWCPSVCPVSILAVTHQGAARDTASVHSRLTIRRTDITAINKLQCLQTLVAQTVSTGHSHNGTYDFQL